MFYLHKIRPIARPLSGWTAVQNENENAPAGEPRESLWPPGLQGSDRQRLANSAMRLRLGSRAIQATRATLRNAWRVLAAAVVLGSGAASAASVDLVVNVASDKASYTASETQTYTVVLTNRGPGNATNASFSLNVPSTQGSTQPWNTGVGCVASGGAVCPTAYALSPSTTLGATVPSLPMNGKLILTVPAPGTPASQVSGGMNVVAGIAPGSADTNADGSTDTSNIFVYIAPPQLSFGTTVAGPAAVATPGNTQGTYTVVLQNTGTDTNSFFSNLALAASQGTGSASSLPYLPGTRFNSISCTGATGGASCANLVATNSGGFILSPQPNPLVDPASTSTSLAVGATQMPGGSTITLTVVVDVGTSICSTNGAGDNRVLSLSSGVGNINPGGAAEQPLSAADNTATQTTTVGAAQCAIGDLLVNGIAQPAAQTSNGLGPNAPFSYTATYSNASGATAANIPLDFSFSWPTGGVVMNTPTCVASGAAVCPGTYSISNGVASAVAPSIPVGGSLQITYTGTSGPDTTRRCRPLAADVRTSIRPPNEFQDTNYNQIDPLYQVNANRMGNNSYEVITQADIGVACTASYDAVITKSGPYLDLAATIPAPLPLTAGQYVYFKVTATNAAPGLPLLSYNIYDEATITYGPAYDQSSATPGYRFSVAPKPGDPPGLTTPSGYSFGGTPWPLLDMGVHCTASGGAVCPDFATPAGSTNGTGVGLRTSGWQASWSSLPPFPVGAQLEFVSTYRVPILRPVAAAGGCASTASLNNGINVATIDGTSVNPTGLERSGVNNNAQVSFSASVPACDQTLAVSKTIQSPVVPPSGLVEYTIVATNTSASNLDLPRLVDITGGTPVMAITCQSTTLGAVCPSFTPQQGIRVLADGSSHAVTAADAISGGALSQFDFVWGSVGAATMPPGSTVTFQVTAQYAAGRIPGTNLAFFTADPSSQTGHWPIVRATAGPTVPTAGALGVAKAVTPVQAQPGQTVSYTVDALNYVADATDVAFTDTMAAAMAAANPAGFANFTCRAITAADNVFPAGTTVVAATCPAFVMTASGISANIPVFPANSGLRLTYTAVAPAVGSSVPNIAQLQHTAGAVTRGDASSQVNYSVPTSVVLSGNVFNDVNGSQVKDGSESSTTLPAGLQAVIVDANGVTVATVPVDANGNYSSPVPANGTYTVTVTPPAGWLATGENLAGLPDGTPNSQQTVVVGSVDRPDVNFGMEQPPIAGQAQYPSQTNPGGTLTVPVDSGAFVGALPSGVTGTNASDPAPGAVTGVTIPRFPSNATSITINGVSYTAATFPPAGVSVTVAQLAGMVLDPVDGAVSVVIPYTIADAAAKVSQEGSVTLPLTAARPAAGPDVSTTTSVVNNNNGTVTFTVATSNAPAVGTATNTVTTLKLPSGLTGVVVSNGGTYDAATGVVTWPPITLAPGASNPAPQTVTIPYTNGSSVKGDATVTTTGEDSQVLANNPSSATLGTPRSPDAVPALGDWGLAMLMGLLLLGGLVPTFRTRAGNRALPATGRR